MPRWPCAHMRRTSCKDWRASLRTEPQLVKLMVPRSVFGARPHLIITPSDSRSYMRATGMLCVMATLNRVENCHQGRVTENSPSTSSRLAITSRRAIRKAYGPLNDKDTCPPQATGARRLYYPDSERRGSGGKTGYRFSAAR